MHTLATPAPARHYRAYGEQRRQLVAKDIPKSLYKANCRHLRDVFSGVSVGMFGPTSQGLYAKLDTTNPKGDTLTFFIGHPSDKDSIFVVQMKATDDGLEITYLLPVPQADRIRVAIAKNYCEEEIGAYIKAYS